jgi:hypothetical protein
MIPTDKINKLFSEDNEVIYLEDEEEDKESTPRLNLQ